MLSFAACATNQPQQSVAEASVSGSPTASEFGLPAVFQSPEASATAVMAGATSSSSDMAAASPAASDLAVASPQVSVSVATDAASKTVDKIIDVNALNSVFAADTKLAENGEQMIVGASGNTLTYNLTFNKNIGISDLPADFKTTMDTTLQDAINQAVKLYPGLPSCTFVYNVINGISGQTLLTVSKEYSAQ